MVLRIDLTCIVAAFIFTNAISVETPNAEIPESIQRVLLSKVPQADVNRDGKITLEELKKAAPGLPAKYQKAIRRRFPEIGHPKKGSPMGDSLPPEGQSSESNEQLQRLFERFPEADANTDGVLAQAEAIA